MLQAAHAKTDVALLTVPASQALIVMGLALLSAIQLAAVLTAVGTESFRVMDVKSLRFFECVMFVGGVFAADRPLVRVITYALMLEG